MITHLADTDSLETLETLEITGDAYRHLFRARRLAKGARLRIVDGAGTARWSEVVEIDRRRAVVHLQADAPTHESPLHLELLVGALKPDRASWLVEKATELGVAAIRFLHTERTPRNYGDAQLDRWRRVAAAAVEQSHRALVPEITGIHPWTEIPNHLAHAATPGILPPPLPHAPQGRQLVAGAVSPRSSPRPAHQAALIGPEGGFTETELQELLQQGAHPLDLGPRVLRVETAAVAIAALLLCPTNSSPDDRQNMGE